MSYDPPRPYRPHLASPTSYDSLQTPPSIGTWSDGSLSSLGEQQSKDATTTRYYPSPSPLQPPPPASAGYPAPGYHHYAPPPSAPPSQQLPPPPPAGNVHEKPGQYSVKMGGTGVLARKESSARRTKRISLMLVSGIIVCGIIVLIVLGCKKML
ncbi:hypothetical protein JCM3774_006525 [Rhodotorula dairenensis]